MMMQYGQIKDAELPRREFMYKTVAASIGVTLAGTFANASELLASEPKKEAGKKMIWANLIHLSFNMWCDWDSPEYKTGPLAIYPDAVYRSYLRFDEKLWNDMLLKMAKVGMTMVVIDLGDGVKYQSHPEIGVKNAWTIDKLEFTLKRSHSRD